MGSNTIDVLLLINYKSYRTFLIVKSHSVKIELMFVVCLLVILFERGINISSLGLFNNSGFIIWLSVIVMTGIEFLY